jgi:hypothetical protein
MLFKKLIWTLKRHPFLYTTRFKLLSKNSNITEIENCSYNCQNLKTSIPDYFHQINKDIFRGYTPKDDFESVKRISTWLREHIKGGRGLSHPSELALKAMLSGEGGVCSDIVQVFNNFCVINNIKVREWGITRAPFDESYGGHSFNEIFSEALNKWILIDVSWSVIFYNKEGVPLSVVEFYNLLRKNGAVIYKPILENNILERENISYNYLDFNTVPFLICNYSNERYDKVLKYSRPYIPVFISHFALFMVNKSYHYKFPLDNYKKIFS